MNDLRIHLSGMPFVGIQETTRDKVPDDRGLKTYCLLQPPNETELGGMHGIPFDPDPEHPWARGIQGLAAVVVQTYGHNYHANITFNPPSVERVGSDEHGWCILKYERLSKSELEKFQNAAQRWIQLHQK